MPNFIAGLGPICSRTGQCDPCGFLELEIADLGSSEGIDVSIYVDHPNRIVFETILASPESTLLLTSGSDETEAFWGCICASVCIYGIQQVYLTARCNSSLYDVALSLGRMDCAGTRNVRFLRLVEDIVDELKTREPTLSVNIVTTHRNPHEHNDNLG